MRVIQATDHSPTLSPPAPTLSARIAWIDGYRFRLVALMPELTAIDAVQWAFEAFESQGERSSDPVKAAEAFARVAAHAVSTLGAPMGS